MVCRQCQGIENIFDDKWARSELREYRRKGPRKATRMLLDAIKSIPIEGKSLLDIGGGVGVLQHELLKAGVRKATGVDASTAYIKAVKEEAERQGHDNLVDYHHGDFVDLAATLELADIVTLDRVICCYHDVEQLVGESSRLAVESYGLVFPRDNWAIRGAFRLFNLALWLRRSPFRIFVHSGRVVDSLVRRNGLEPRFRRNTLFWQVVVYGR